MRLVHGLAAVLLAALACGGARSAETDLRAIRRQCDRTAARPPSDPRLVEAIRIAREQHRLFGGQTIGVDGGMTTVGYHEAEYDHPQGETTPTWRRVAEFWQALDRNAPPTYRQESGAWVERRDLDDRLARLAAAAEPATPVLDAGQREALSTAMLRSALVDQPWSAAFISFVVRRGGFTQGEFAFSDSHVDYVERALAASRAEAAAGSADHAWRACDVRTTRIRAGDMLCSTRSGSAGVRTFDELAAALDSRGEASFPMHCDLAVAADDGGNAKLETIGGNVYQSVTLRRMFLTGGKVLSPRYFASDAARRCEAAGRCVGNLHRRPWVVLLQFRH